MGVNWKGRVGRVDLLLNALDSWLNISIWKARLVDRSAFIVSIELKLSLRPIGFASDFCCQI